MDIAVIIPMYNGAKWIRATIKSILAQSCLPSEIIIVDNNSTDSSVEIANSFPGIKLINNPIQSPNFSRQCGFQTSTAKFIAYLDQDDIWHPEHLNYLSLLLEQRSDYPAAVASSLSFSSSQNIRFPRPTFEGVNFNPWNNFPINQIPTPSNLMIRREALESIGGWPTQFNFCGDIYTWLRLSTDHAFIRNKGITVAYRRHSSSQSSTLLAKNTQKCFQDLSTALEDALTYYPAFSKPNYYSQLQKRLSTLSVMSIVLENIINFNSSQFTKAIILLEEHLSNEKKGFVSSMCGLLIWFLYSHLANQPTLFSHLLQYWPQEATRTRQAFEERITSSRLLPKCLLSDPFNKSLWSLLIQSSDKILEKLPLYRQ